MRRSPSYVLAALLAIPCAMPVMAQKASDPASQALAEFYVSPAWRALLDEAPGEWIVDWCKATSTPRSILGSGLQLADWRGNSIEEARRQAELLLQQRAELLGLGASTFRESIGARMGRTWSFTFDQYFHGLPVIGGRADVRVHMVGRVSMFGSTAWQIPANFNTTPAFDHDTATAIAWQDLKATPTGVPQPAPAAAPRLVIWGDVTAAQPGTCHLAWEVAISNVAADGSGPIGRYYVDARNGRVLHWTNDKHECGIPGCTVTKHRAAAAEPAAPTAQPAVPPVLTTVTVQAWTRTGLDGTDPLVNTPLPGLVLNVPGIGAVTTDNNGQFQINIAAAVSIPVGQLDGRHHAPIVGASAPSGSFLVNPGVATTIQLLTAGATSAQGAHPTMSYWCDKVNEYARSILGNTPQLNTANAILPNVNIALPCNAYYAGNTLNFYQAGGGCNNAAFSTVIAHEWGHGLDDQYGGTFGGPTDGLSEGWGDIIALYLVDNPNLGTGFVSAGVSLRNGNNTRQYGTATEEHDAGESWMGFAWKLRDRLATTLASRPAAIALTNDIVVGTIVANATDQPGAVLEVFIADDNDGNLANGTPHSADLIWACNQHSLPYPNPSQPNNDCLGAIALVNGINGPYSNVGATTSSPAWPCGPGGNDVWFSYYAGAAGTLTVSTCTQASFDTTIQIFSGSCGALTSVGCLDDSCSLQTSLSVPVTAGPYRVRVGGYNGLTGSFSLNVNGPAAVSAASVPYGTGCGFASKAFYELFASAATFDLGGSAMRLVRNGNFYVAQTGGAYVAPPGGATVLTLGDDASVAVTLAGSFPFPGGTTTALEVCSNGFVSAAAGNGTDYQPSIAAWLGSPQPRWGTWHDFNPNAAGSGQVKFHESGSISYVTWQGVYSYNTTSANTLQLQFDRSTGNVTYVWPTIVANGGAWLVGYAATGPNNDPGNRDISATLPGTFRNSADNASALALAATVPVLGSTLTFTTTQYPASSLLGLQALGLTHIDPGVPLDVIGMQGCFQYSSLDVLNVMFPVGQQSTYAMSVPNNPALMGFQMSGQSIAFVNGVNSAGLVTSNGVGLTLGI